MPSPSKAIKALHRKQGRGVPLKAFARELQNDKQHKEIAAAWFAVKRPAKKAKPSKPTAESAGKPVLKNRK